MNPSLFNTLVPALLHTLWIGLVVALLLFVALRQLTAQNARLRYALSMAALIAVFVGGLVAWELPNAKPQSSAAITLKANQTDPSNPSYQPQPTAPASISQPQASILKSPASSSPNWHLWLGIAWLLGAGISLLRVVRVSCGVQQLIRRSRAVECPVATRLMAELSRMAGTSRRVILLTGEHVLQPAVAGIFRPVLFLPLSVLTGLPEWQLRAILAHELAHIVRHDFLVNALHLLAETILFFNPAVWWINRRIREEREACCDALAAHWIDNHHELAETLLDQATLQHSALPAFSDSNPGTLKSRILRLVNPSRQPNLKLPWKSLLLVALIATGGLLIAKKGTSEAVGYLKRIRMLTAIQEKHDDPSTAIHRNSTHLFDEVTIDIPIRTSGDIPNLFPLVILLNSGPSNHGILMDLSENDKVEQSGNRALFRKSMKSYAPIGYIDSFYIEGTHIGRVESSGAPANKDGVIRLPEVELKAGFEGSLRFVTPDGKSVTNVIATGGTTGLNGLKKTGSTYTMPSCSQVPIKIQIIPPDGYINETREITFKSNEVTDWVLQPGIPFSGQIVDQQGIPVKGAEVRLAGGPENRGLWRVDDHPAIATTDASGRFKFTSMAAGQSYNLLIMADGYMGKSSGLITAQESGKTFTLMSQKRIEVRIENTQLLNRKTVVYSTSLQFHGGYSGTGLPEEWCRLVSSNSTSAVYELSNLWEGQNQLRFGRVMHHFFSSEVAGTLTIDIAEKLPPEKRVIPHTFTFNLIPPNNNPMPKGTFRITYLKEIVRYSFDCSITPDGIVHAGLMVTPGSEIQLSSETITGYKVSQTFTADATNMVVEVPLIPTGCIMVTCTDPNGSPLKDYTVRIETQDPPGQLPTVHTIPNVDEFVYINESIALNRKYRVRVSKVSSDGKMKAEHETEWFALSNSRPVKKLRCVLKPVD